MMYGQITAFRMQLRTTTTKQDKLLQMTAVRNPGLNTTSYGLPRHLFMPCHVSPGRPEHLTLLVTDMTVLFRSTDS